MDGRSISVSLTGKGQAVTGRVENAMRAWVIGSDNITRHPLCFPVRKNQVLPHEMLIKTPVQKDGRLQLLSGELLILYYLSRDVRKTEINTKLSAYIRVRMLIRAAWSDYSKRLLPVS